MYRIVQDNNTEDNTMATAYKMFRKKDVFPEINVVGTLNIKQHTRRGDYMQQ